MQNNTPIIISQNNLENSNKNHTQENFNLKQKSNYLNNNFNYRFLSQF